MGGHQVPLFSPAVVKSTVQPFFFEWLKFRCQEIDTRPMLCHCFPDSFHYKKTSSHDGITKVINFAPPCQRPISASAASWHTSCLLPTVHLIQGTLFARKKTHTNDFQAHNWQLQTQLIHAIFSIDFQVPFWELNDSPHENLICFIPSWFLGASTGGGGAEHPKPISSQHCLNWWMWKPSTCRGDELPNNAPNKNGKSFKFYHRFLHCLIPWEWVI